MTETSVDLVNLFDNQKHFNSFFALFLIYLKEEIDTEFSYVQQLVLKKTILSQKSFLKLIGFIDNQECVGFIMAQIDNQLSDWNEKEGWGFIREFYVSPPYRKCGLGTILLDTVLRLLDVENVYLTSEKNHRFWLNHGFIETNEIAQNNLAVYIKKCSNA